MIRRRLAVLSLALASALALAPVVALAQDEQPVVAPLPPSSAVAPVAQVGVVVLAVDGATDAAWPLAQLVYGDSGLRPAALDDATARVLAGEAPKPDAPPRVRELAEVRAAVHGDDVPSRRLLASLARELGVAAIAVVSRGERAPSFRLFLASSGQMDVVSFAPDATEGAVSWKGAVEAMRPRVGRRDAAGPRAEPQRTDAPAGPEASKGGGSFLTSKWFWGAVVIAGVAGAFFLASRPGSTDPTTVQLRGHVQQ